jgi:hypothetical protein
MARSAAERQRAYRERRLEDGASRLDCIVSASAIDELGRLAQHRGVTRSQALELIIGEAYRALVDSPGTGDAKGLTVEPVAAVSNDGQSPKSWRDRLREMGAL